MIIKFKIFEQTSESKVGTTFTIKEILDRNNNWRDFSFDLRDLMTGCEVEVIRKDGSKKTLRVNGFYHNKLERYDQVDEISILGSLNGINDRILLDYYTTITILKKPKIIVSDYDPYGEEDWEY